MSYLRKTKGSEAGPMLEAFKLDPSTWLILSALVLTDRV